MRFGHLTVVPFRTYHNVEEPLGFLIEDGRTKEMCIRDSADTKKRIAELQTEQRKAAAEVEQMDRLSAMCEEFTRYRVQAITESVNSKFRLTRWRLFTEQVNGCLLYTSRCV